MLIYKHDFWPRSSVFRTSVLWSDPHWFWNVVPGGWNLARTSIIVYNERLWSEISIFHQRYSIGWHKFSKIILWAWNFLQRSLLAATGYPSASPTPKLRNWKLGKWKIWLMVVSMALDSVKFTQNFCWNSFLH